MLNALRNHFNKKSNIDTTPNPISSKRLKTETSNIPPQSASGLSLSQTQLITIINAIASPGVWDEQMSDMVPELIPGLPNWPAARGLVIHIPYGNEEEIVHRFHRHDEATHGLAKNVRTFDEDIHLYLENDHYSVFDKKSQRYLPIEKDGDCFYNAVLTACHRHNPREARALGKNAYALRQHMADYIRRQPDKVQLFVDQNQIHIDPPQHVPVIDSAFPNDITMRTPSPVPQSPLFLSRHANLDIPTEKLPTETWHQIAHYLDAPDISRLQQTNHAWKDFMQSDAIWLPRLTPAAQQSLKAQHKTETTNASTAFAKPSAYTQFIANPLTRRGLVFGNSRDYQQVVNTVSAHLTTLLKTHPHRLNIVALEEISPANVHTIMLKKTTIT
ncbi:MAG: F-box protein [Ottowia sp.]|nr:F-box protein [Ottowia sp.]